MSVEKDGYTRRRLLGLIGLAGAGTIMPSLSAEKEESILGSNDVRYDKLRSLFNSDVERKPKWVAQCKTEEDIQRAVGLAINEDLPVAVKSGGHCFIGSSVNNGGMSINLRSLDKKVYLPKQQKLITGPGVKLGELYDLLLPYDRLLPAGSCAGVGIGGLTLGGGYGLFARQHGLTCDHLTRVRMVTGTGEIVDSENDPDLLWACRGGGNGNFGAITSMEFQTQSAPKNLGAQRLTAKGLNEKQMLSLVQNWFEVTEGLPDPIFSALVLNGFYNVSGGFYKGIKNLTHCLTEIIQRVQNNSGLIFQVNTLGGAIMRGSESAYAHREFPYLGEIQAYWQRPQSRQNLVNQVDAIQNLIGSKRHYRNYPDKNLENYSEAYYGDKLEKLQMIKQRYDPDNRFRHAQSIVGKI